MIPTASPVRRVLIVSPHFPPTNAPDHQRVRTSLPYFRECGWTPTVLAVDAHDVEGDRDPLLAATIPADVAVERVHALPVRWTRLAGIGNLAYRAWNELDRAGERLLRGDHFDLVYFSTTLFVATTLGRRWRDLLGTAYVVDIQDPWRTDYYEQPGAPKPPGGWKYQLARWQSVRLEERAWRDAAGFISVSPEYLEQLRLRYPWFRHKAAAVVPFGAPEADFAFVRGHPEIPAAFARLPGKLHIVAVGAVGPIMQPAIEALLDGLAALRERNAAGLDRLRVHFIGTSYAPAGRRIESVAPLAAARGLAAHVEERAERVSYFTALQTLLAADAVLLPGSNATGYSPSKIGACALAGRPVLALLPPQSVAAARMRELGFASIAAVGTVEAAAQVRAFFEALLRNPSTLPTGVSDPEKFAREDTARACTRRQCDLFDAALAHDA